MGRLIFYTHKVCYENNINFIKNEEFITRAYPVPATDRLTLEFQFEKSSNVNISIYDVNGRIISRALHENFPSGLSRIDLDVSFLENGIYLYRISNDEDQYSTGRFSLK